MNHFASTSRKQLCRNDAPYTRRYKIHGKYDTSGSKLIGRSTAESVADQETVHIGWWVVRTLYSIDESAHLAKEMKTNEIDVMGSSE